MTQTSQTVRLTVIGAGAWGTVLAQLLANQGHTVTLWTRRAEHAAALTHDQENKAYLPGVALSNLSFSANLTEAIQHVDAAVIAVPSQGLHEVLGQLPQLAAIISATKGLELGSFKRVTQIISSYQPQATLAALSGPNLAREIAEGKPAASTLACTNEAFAVKAQGWFKQPTFRVYRSRDVIGVEVAGALKNVIALAAGMSDALGLGENARASIITRGLAEIVRLGVALGADPKTFYGLAGLGDMIATCASSQSRNHRAGEQFVKGATLATIRASGLTAEGIPTVNAVQQYASQHGLELPISGAVYDVVYKQTSPAKALENLMKRDMKAE